MRKSRGQVACGKQAEWQIESCYYFRVTFIASGLQWACRAHRRHTAMQCNKEGNPQAIPADCHNGKQDRNGSIFSKVFETFLGNFFGVLNKTALKH